jgi:uncharacterized DUF497 family protein
MLEFEWDDNKNKSNIEKHKLSFELAKYVFEDDSFVNFIDTKKDYGETRFLGFSKIEEVLFCVSYTIRKNKIRLISLRKAREKELNKYLKENKQ